jgi:hypothetical protein
MTLPKIILLVIIAAGFFTAGWKIKAHFIPAVDNLLAQATLTHHAKSTGLGLKLNQETVDIIGGSMAHGWLDPKDNSYLRRAFTTRSQSTNTNYKYVDHTFAGETPYLLDTNDKAKFALWLKTDHPQVVVFSWGIENSMSSHHQTSIDQFASGIHDEIAETLKAHATVLIVTPPLTQELVVNDRLMTDIWINRMFQVASSFKSDNVYIEDIDHQMQLYVTAHGKTYKDYYGNSWHPNQAGHELAGNLLANDLVQTFGFGPITFK